MPELNNDASHAAALDAAAPESTVSDVVWPELATSGSGADSEIADPAVRTILDQVREVSGLPVSEHPAAYAGMHDALLEALNEEPLNEEPQHDRPWPGSGAA